MLFSLCKEPADEPTISKKDNNRQRGDERKKKRESERELTERKNIYEVSKKEKRKSESGFEKSEREVTHNSCGAPPINLKANQTAIFLSPCHLPAKGLGTQSEVDALQNELIDATKPQKSRPAAPHISYVTLSARHKSAIDGLA